MRTTVSPPRSDSKVAIGYKLAIGAGAGVCLALVKLLEVNFYIGQPPPVVIGGLLAAAAFLLVGALFTAFGTDEHQTGKLFMAGLLAPSLIIAIVHRGADSQPPQQDSHAAIPTLGALTDLAIPTLYAAEQPPPAAARAQVKTITKEQVEPSKLDGALMLIGRTPPAQSYLYVVGKTADRAQAEKTAARLRSALDGSQMAVNIVKAETGADFYVVVGSLQTASSAAATKQQAIAKAANNPHADPHALALLANGPVVDAKTLVGASGR